MEALSIATGVVSLTAALLTTAKRLTDLASRFQLASVTLRAIISEITLVSATLGKIQSALIHCKLTERSPSGSSSISSTGDLGDVLDTALIGCTVVLSALQAELGELEAGIMSNGTIGTNKTYGMSYVARAKLLWKEGTMKQLLEELRGQQLSLGVLLSALNMNSLTDLHTLALSSQQMLERLTKSTESLRKTYPSIKAPRSVFDEKHFDTVSLLSHSASTAGATEFDFDGFLIDSSVYRRAFMGGYLRPRHESMEDEDEDEDIDDRKTVTNGEVEETRDNLEDPAESSEGDATPAHREIDYKKYKKVKLLYFVSQARSALAFTRLSHFMTTIRHSRAETFRSDESFEQCMDDLTLIQRILSLDQRKTRDLTDALSIYLSESPDLARMRALSTHFIDSEVRRIQRPPGEQDPSMRMQTIYEVSCQRE